MKNKRFKSALSLLLVLLLCFSVMAPSFAAQTVDLAATGDDPPVVEWHANSGTTPRATVGKDNVLAIFEKLGVGSGDFYGIKAASANNFTNVTNNTTNVNAGAYTICRTATQTGRIFKTPDWSAGTSLDITVKLYYIANFGVSGTDDGEIYLDGNKVSGDVKLYPGTEYTVTAKEVEDYTYSINGANDGVAFTPTADMTITAVYTPDARASVSLEVTGDGTAQVLVNGEDANGVIPVGASFSVKTTANTDKGYKLDSIVVTQNGTEIEANNGVYGPAENGDEFVVSVTFKFAPEVVNREVSATNARITRNDLSNILGSYSYYGIAPADTPENITQLVQILSPNYDVENGDYMIYATNDDTGLIPRPVWDNAKVMLLRVRTYYTGTFSVTGSENGEVYLNNEPVTGSVNLYTDTEYTVTAKDVAEYDYTITGTVAGTAFTPSANITVTVNYLKTAFATYELNVGDGGTAQVLVNGEAATNRISEGDSFTVTATPDLLHVLDAITVTNGNETVTPNDNGEYGPVADGEVYLINVTFKTPDPENDTEVERDVKSAGISRSEAAGFFGENYLTSASYAIAPADDPTATTTFGATGSVSVAAGRYIVFKGPLVNPNWSNPNDVRYITVRTYASVTFAVTGCNEGEIKLNGETVSGSQKLYTDTEYTVTAKAVDDYDLELSGAQDGVAFTPDANTPATITATYTKNKFATYTLSVGDGGTAEVLVNGEPAGDRISEGDSFTVKATPNENAGYKLDSIVVTKNGEAIEANEGVYGPAEDQAVYAITVNFIYDPPRAEIDVDANNARVTLSNVSGFFNGDYNYYGIAKEKTNNPTYLNIINQNFNVQAGEYFIYGTNDGNIVNPNWDNAKLMILNVKTYYTVTWKNWDGTELASDHVYNGDTPSYTGETPVRPEDMNATYTFSAWDDGTTTYLIGVDDLPPVTGDITYTAVYTGETKPLFAAHSVTLGGDIGVNFYIDSNVAGVADAQTAVVKFAWDGGKYKEEVNLKELTPNDKGWLKATVNVVAAQMAHTIEAVAYINGEMIYTVDLYSVQEYAEAVYAEPEKYDPEKPEQLKALAAAMLHYGSEAQTVFADALNVKFDRADSNLDVAADYSGVTADAVAAAINGTSSDLDAIASQLDAEFYTSSLIYLQNNTLRLYFTPASMTIGALNDKGFSGNLSKYYYYADKANIAAAELDDQQEFAVGDVTFTYSPLDYVKAVIESANMTDTQKNLAKSLFLYNQAANAYFG